MVAKDIMTKRVITVTPATTVKELARILGRHRISGVPVTDKHGRVMGVASEADIVFKKGNRVKSIMSDRVISVDEATPVERVAELMTTHRIKRVPVMRGEKLVGIISRADMVRAIAKGQHIALHTPIYDL
jgi:CBS domain-containing protein